MTPCKVCERACCFALGQTLDEALACLILSWPPHRSHTAHVSIRQSLPCRASRSCMGAPEVHLQKELHHTCPLQCADHQ